MSIFIKRKNYWDPNDQIKCKCGCGCSLSRLDVRGRPHYYIMNHHIRGKKLGRRESISGEKNYGWKGGRRGGKIIRIKVYEPHPRKSKDGYVAEHILVIEKYLGRHLTPTEIVFHKNGNSKDNRLDNLELTTKAGVMKKQQQMGLMKNSNPLRGSKHHNWKGGISSLMSKIRNLPEYKKWRLSVYYRDNNICRNPKCPNPKIGRNHMRCHHIKPIALIIKEFNIVSVEDAVKCSELWDVNNGLTLCENCHKQTYSYKHDVTI